jgi:dTDP-4-dehydrorhamnose 3,5-epimerase
MKLETTPLPGMLVLVPKVFGDHRGFFMETYNRKAFAEQGLDVEFVQDNLSRSIKGTLRGLHYQLDPHAQGKLVRVTQGEVFDVGVDLREGSPTFGRWHGEILSAENKRALWLPPGLAHGFLALSDDTEFHYKCTSLYAPASDRGLRWNDPTVGIEWPVEPDPALLSKKDAEAPLWAEAERNFVFRA